jgi:tetratricopeptide (TPR) repeat protein
MVPRRAPLLAGGLLLLATLLAYAGTFSAPFVFDAAPIATAYPSLRHLWPLGPLLQPPHDGSTVEGRPLLNLSLAVSYALSGTRPWAYHAMNLAIHGLAVLALFGSVRRTLRRGAAPDAATAARALGLAWVVALLWAVHPLQTESVTYVIQRAESLMGLFYLCTLYAFIRGAAPDEAAHVPARARTWLGLAWISCLAGMATKEVMVSAPVVVLLYDRTFVAGSLREAWRRRRGFYGALASTWLLLGWLVAGTGSRAGTAGSTAPLPWSHYAATQVYGIARYLRLAVWPHPLVFDYGTVVVTGWAHLVGPAVVLTGLAVLTLAGLVRNRAAGFLGAVFFAVLAPTSLVPIATQTLAEHRMYLPLAAVLAALVLLLARGAEAVVGRGPRALAIILATGMAAGLALGAMTLRRNRLYQDEVALWADSALHWPGNARAHLQLGAALDRTGRIEAAARDFERSLILQPTDNALAHYDLGHCLLEEGRAAAAAGELAEAVRLDPANGEASNNLGNALMALGRPQAAIPRYRAARALRPGDGNVCFNLGNALVATGDFPGAAAAYAASLERQPDHALAHFNLGNVEAQLGDLAAAIGQYEAALRLDPANVPAQDNLGNALFQEGRYAEALVPYGAAARLAPGDPRIHYNLANALLRCGRAEAAAAEYAAALRLRPDFPEARVMLERLRAAGAR